jgi:hypothetical protein
MKDLLCSESEDKTNSVDSANYIKNVKYIKKLKLQRAVLSKLIDMKITQSYSENEIDPDNSDSNQSLTNK